MKTQTGHRILPSLATRLWLLLTMPASEYVHSEYNFRRISRWIGMRKLLGLLLGSLIGLLFGVAYLAGILPIGGIFYTFIMLACYSVLYYEYWQVPALPQRDVRHALTSGLVYVVTCARIVNAGYEYGWIVGAILLVGYCFVFPMIRAMQFKRDTVKSHDVI